MKAVTVLEVIDKIEAISEFQFHYEKKDLDVNRLVSIKMKKKNIRKILQDLFKDSSITYEINDRDIILSNIEVSPATKVFPKQKDIDKPQVQQFRVNGTVTAPDHTPLPGVNIILKGMNQGTMSDLDGNYGIDVKSSDTLSFSFIGYKTVEIPVDKRTTINIQMEEAVTALEEVEVNAGYYTVKDRERTGNISRITAAEIERQPVANPLQALAGRMPGVEVIQESGVPGATFRVRIRGQNSIRDNIGVNAPLYIIDGVPFPSSPLNPLGVDSNMLPNSISPFNSIDPSNIASIEVLKDADATAIYGSRGSNGVVLITTKKGIPGKSRVDINIYSGAGKVTGRMDLLNTKQFLEMRYEAFANDDVESFLENPDFDRFFPELKIWDQNRYTDWQKELIGGTAYYNNAKISLSGGNKNTQYLIGGSYFRQTTVYPGDQDDTRISGHFNLSHTTSNQKFKVSLTASYTSDDINLFTEDLTQRAMTLPPNAPLLYTDKGGLNWENSTWENPLAFLEAEYNGITDNFIANATLDYQLIPGLHISSQLGYTNIQVKEMRIRPLSMIDPALRAGRTGLSVLSDSYRKTWIVEPKVQYKRHIGQGVLDLLVGGTFQQNVNEVRRISGSGYTNDALLKNIQAASDIRIGQSSYTQYRYNAFFGRINYNWKKKYIVNLTGRRDGSTRFGPGKRFADFGAVGAAWIFSKEPFLENSFISFGKLRGSYGTTGSDAIGDYGYLDTYTSTQYPYLGQPGLIPTRLANPDYQWETNKKLEVGLEIGLSQDRIFLSGSWYRNRSSNQLVGFPLPVITGQPTIQFNLPATVENKGWEFTLNTINIRTDHFSWHTGFNISFPENKLLEYENIEASPFANQYQVGKSLFVFPGFHFLGVDEETGLYTFENTEGNSTSNPEWPLDLQFRKEISRKYEGGVQNTVNYKDFELDVFLQFVKQTGSYIGSFNSPGGPFNQPVRVMDRWQQPGDMTHIQRFLFNDLEALEAYDAYRSSDGGIIDASYIRLTNLSLSWNLPKKLGFGSNSKLYLRGQNLFTITNFPGLDPETQSSSMLPPLRVLTLGIQLSF
ncbi:SusC/RagA family TonB-linked outer membrane protein [Sinomicrobium weinanense]|uniref:SusC/RagA family TonB-linked outer membrane protein n=1 Tax=Sinomicrobium weinanense TaxID=2842200 RepID=A0A926JPJ8_9FLAO|nr:SusC/RagA family TonB-linked outer membrane protein [Sinomicrobium weinanense]MBC9795125.1 SusC/RagA family TonB-linked outer membrane protein [Sinomicrobium weinanense]MBU3123743.1 SusC/RagA family TonB-linked outer membrane protein [Sinomicrobium weinanense]